MNTMRSANCQADASPCPLFTVRPSTSYGGFNNLTKKIIGSRIEVNEARINPESRTEFHTKFGKTENATCNIPAFSLLEFVNTTRPSQAERVHREA